MKWVKISDKEPQSKIWRVRHSQHGTHSIDSSDFQEFGGDTVRFFKHESLLKSNVEWLDETESLPADVEEARPVESMTHDEANALWAYLGFNPDYERLYKADGMPEKTTLQFFQNWFFREPKFGGHSERFDFPNTKKLFAWLAAHGFDIGTQNTLAQNTLTQNTAEIKMKDELLREAIVLIRYCTDYATFIREYIDIERKYMETWSNYDMNISTCIPEIIARFRSLTSSNTSTEAQIEGKEEGWISVKHKPLYTETKLGWLTTPEGSEEFMAAVPYIDSSSGKSVDKWWIRHCVVSDGVGLAVVGDDDNQPAGWELDAVTHWKPIPKPPTA